MKRLISYIVNFYFFYKKIFIPTLFMSFAIRLILAVFVDFGIINSLLIIYSFIAPINQFLIYEIRYPHEYYFYYNLGFSKPLLWLISILISLLIIISVIF